MQVVNLLDELEAAPSFERKVSNHQVKLVGAHQVECGLDVARFSANDKVVVSIDQVDQSLPNDGVIIDK